MDDTTNLPIQTHHADALPRDAVRESARQTFGVAEERPSIAIFSMPKPFGNCSHIDVIQTNAIRSWAALGGDIEVILLGDEPGVAETAAELNVRHLSGLQYNQHGTPLVNSAFRLARQHTQAPLLMYCNADVILLRDLLKAIELVDRDKRWSDFVAFGRRIDYDQSDLIDFGDNQQVNQLLTGVADAGKIASQVCKEYFVFSRELFRDMPDFAVGRGNWDNWVIHHAKQTGVPVVNVSELVSVIHQNHDYGHTGAGRMQCYVSGDEAKNNQQLAGGRHLISGSVGTWRLTQEGIRRERPLLLNPAFWADVPRFTRLMFHLFGSRS